MKHTITLSPIAETWMATFSNPQIAEAMGTDTIPTAYTTKTCAEAVQKEIQKLNPDCRVVVSNSIDKTTSL